jgi:hypothetical protein
MPLPSYKVLGQANPSSGTRTALYSVPRFYNSKVTTLTICNTGTVADRFNIEIQDYSSNNTSTAYYTNYNTWINAKDTIILNQHFSLNQGSNVYITPVGTSNLSFSLFGKEQYAPYSVTPNVEYLVVGGGGSGGYAAGGGAGGLLTSVGYGVNKDTLYTVTIGAGGARAGPVGYSGNNSVFNNITAFGGGPGTDGRYSANGASGGGSAYGYYVNFLAGNGIYPGSSYINAPRQGYDGGRGLNDGGYTWAGGGGGGAGGAGAYSSGAPGGYGGAGGVGAISTIITAAQATTLGTGQVVGGSVYFAGGGSGIGASAPAAPGYGGGGYGGAGLITSDGTPGTSSTGGGGGGGNYGGSGQALYYPGLGGSGVVILRYPNTYPIAWKTTGNPNVITSGGNVIYRFWQSGSITF